jgi:predicted lactoylglutathione lyase
MKKAIGNAKKKFQIVLAIICHSNNSTDNTIQVAKDAGATVLSETEKAMVTLV